MSEVFFPATLASVGMIIVSPRKTRLIRWPSCSSLSQGVE